MLGKFVSTSFVEIWLPDSNNRSNNKIKWKCYEMKKNRNRY